MVRGWEPGLLRVPRLRCDSDGLRSLQDRGCVLFSSLIIKSLLTGFRSKKMVYVRWRPVVILVNLIDGVSLGGSHLTSVILLANLWTEFI